MKLLLLLLQHSDYTDIVINGVKLKYTAGQIKKKKKRTSVGMDKFIEIIAHTKDGPTMT